jgi:hypothetical protein
MDEVPFMHKNWRYSTFRKLRYAMYSFETKRKQLWSTACPSHFLNWRQTLNNIDKFNQTRYLGILAMSFDAWVLQFCSLCLFMPSAGCSEQGWGMGWDRWANWSVQGESEGRRTCGTPSTERWWGSNWIATAPERFPKVFWGSWTR